MSKKNYNKMSGPSNEVITGTQNVVIEDEVVNNEQKEEKEEKEEKVIGVVCNCDKLNVRKKPNAKSEVAAIIGKGVEVEIVNSDSTEDFYLIRGINQFVNGYCMKKYISIKE